MKQRMARTIMVLVTTVPIYSGHLRNKSISLRDLSAAYRVETIEAFDNNQHLDTLSLNEAEVEEVLSDQIPKQQTLIVYDMRQNSEWSSSYRPFRGEDNFSAIQYEIAREMARRSPMEKIRYLESIAALTSRYPTWLDLIHGEIIRPTEKKEWEETPYSLFGETLREICLEN